MLSVMQSPSDLLHTEKSACLLNILHRETLKNGLLACKGTVRMDEPICWQKKTVVITQTKLWKVLQLRQKLINNEIYELASGAWLKILPETSG